MSEAPDRIRYRVLDLAVDALDLQGARERVHRFVSVGDRAYVCHANVHSTIEIVRDPSLQAVFDGAGLVGADGVPLAWVGKLKGFAVGRVYGPDLMELLAKDAAERGWGSFFLGGREGVAEILSRNLSARFPGFRTVGAFSPPFREATEEEDAALAQLVNASGATFVWFGLGCPKQERWMARLRPLLDAPVLLGVGAAFDFHAGLVRQAPRFLQRAGLEWLFRLSQEPRRLARRYLLYNPWFLLLLAADALGLRRRRANAKA